MKRILSLMCIFTLFMAGVFFAVILRKNEVTEKRNMSYYNDQLYEIGEAYSSGKTEQEIEEEFGCNIIFVTDGGLGNSELSSQYAKRALVMDFAPEGEVIGKVAWNEVGNAVHKTNSRIRRRSILIWVVLLLTGYLLLGLIYILILRPVGEMENFAGEIAKGNLDIPLPVRRGNRFGGLVESFDIMREELKASKEREIEAEKAKKEMALSLSHDMRTPVATIRTACEMIELIAGKRLQQGADPELESIREKERIIDNKAETISRLADNMFHVTLAETEHIEVTVQEEESSLIEEYFHRLKGYGKIVLENSIQPCLVYMDRLRMEQVVDNIVGNSHKYAGTEIRVRFDETEMKVGEKSRRYIRITVRDFGPGVPEEELPLIAEKYYRGNDSAGKPGAGLGMYLASWYMEKQGGGMEYYNDNGFVVELLVRVV